ncbi:MAG: hypothetical protein IT173_04765 [Acidobacteria bacterium]|nr:hypothetical protein [Acidobacteriota bacterium]
MKKTILLFVSLLSFTIAAAAQAPAAKEASPADVGSIGAIMKAVYEVISGDAGQKRDWDRFRSLFHPDAKLIPSGKNAQTGVTGARYLTPEDYITRSGPVLEKNGFHEREMARRVDQFGNIAQVFSTYESFRKKDDKTPFMRGINSFQLMNDGKRWWVINIFWQQESAEHPIPKEYLKSRK